MDINIKSINFDLTKFKPFTVQITCETVEEARLLYTVLSTEKFDEKFWSKRPFLCSHKIGFPHNFGTIIMSELAQQGIPTNMI